MSNREQSTFCDEKTLSTLMFTCAVCESKSHRVRQKHQDGGRKVSGDKSGERDEDGGVGRLESERNSISPGLSAFNPCHILTCWRSINLPVSTARKVSAHIHCVCLWFAARTMAAQRDNL